LPRPTTHSRDSPLEVFASVGVRAISSTFRRRVRSDLSHPLSGVLEEAREDPI
jgi:hypothetical protein